MWCPIPNQLVACVDPFEWFVKPYEAKRLPGLHERDVYTIAEVRHVPQAEISPILLRLAELPAPIRMYPAQRFRPITKPDIGALRALTNPKSKRENA